MPPGGHNLWKAGHTRAQKLVSFGLGSGWGVPTGTGSVSVLGKQQKGCCWQGLEHRFALKSEVSG